MIKNLICSLILTGLLLYSSPILNAAESCYAVKSPGALPCLKENWRLATQLWTFHTYTFYEAVEKTAALGLDWVEAYPGQQLSKDNPDERFHHTMSGELRRQVKEKLNDLGLTVVNYGVVPLPNDEAQCRIVFDFAKDMGIETLVSEPPFDAFEMLDKLCQEYQINIAIHDHPNPSPYWNPDTVLKVCEGRSSRIGACADTGHWMRSGINPLEAIKKLKGRIISLHLKDLNEFGVMDAHDVIWGTGKADMDKILAELKNQNFTGVFSIEYEHNWESSMPEVRKCAEYFYQQAHKLEQNPWKMLLADDLSNCILKPKSWSLQDGVLARHGGGDLWTKDQYGNFILDLDFKVEKGSNSGVFIRTGDLDNWLHTAIEVQIHDTTDGTSRGACGAIYDCLAPSQNAVKPAGQWNRMRIMAKDNMIMLFMNGQQIIDMDLDKWTEPHKNPDGSKNKFNTAYKDMPRSGHIGFQDHGDAVWYRNIRIAPI
ncbi:MAG: DUF1080 domain-containing protein [Sedimentisphaerales bacterium]|nr:DUF1080 domain-containing protein [Sedimentisphaerales bacterium]